MSRFCRLDLPLLSLALALGAGAARAEDDGPLAELNAEHVFVPSGFDDNDNAQVVVDGLMPTPCYHEAKGRVEFDPATKIFTLTPRARVDAGICIQIVAPYTTTFDLGVLPAGHYRIKVPGVEGLEPLEIAEAANAGPDNVLYAAIDNAYVMDVPAQNRSYVVLEGTYTSTCMRWDHTELVHKTANVIEVLPVVRVEERPDCAVTRFPFKGVEVALPRLEKGRYLLHVRGMNGSAKNSIFESMELGR
jgi:hypothetical protein